MPTAPLEVPQKTDAEKAEGDKPIAAKSPLANFITDSLGIKPKAEKKPAPKAEDDEDETADDTKDRPTKPKKPTTPAREPAPAIDEEKLGRSIAAGLAPHLKGAPEKQEEPPPVVDPKEKRRLDVLLHMEQMPEFSERYKGLAERFKANKTKLRDYAKKWETENPGDKFNEDDAQHTEFLDKLEKEVEYDDDDFHEAVADLRVAKKLEEKESKLDARISEIEQREQASQQAPTATNLAVRARNEYWNELGDEFKDMVAEDGSINMQALNTLKESNPVSGKILDDTAFLAQKVAHRIFLLSNGLAKPVGDDVEAEASKFAFDQEKDFLKRKKLDEEGRAFTTRAQWKAMTEAERARHWTLQVDDLLYLAPKYFAKKAKEDLEKEEEKFVATARARRLLPADETPSKAKRNGRLTEGAGDDEDDEPQAGHTRKPLSPSSATSPKSAVLKGLGGAGAKSGLDRWVAESIG